MSQYFQIHPENPQLRLIRRSVDILHEGGVIVYPTDSSYALGCLIGSKTPQATVANVDWQRFARTYQMMGRPSLLREMFRQPGREPREGPAQKKC